MVAWPPRALTAGSAMVANGPCQTGTIGLQVESDTFKGGRLLCEPERSLTGFFSLTQTSPLAEEQPGVAQRFTKKDVSTSLRNSESGMVDQVMLSTNAEGQRFVKLRVSPVALPLCKLALVRLPAPALCIPGGLLACQCVWSWLGLFRLTASCNFEIQACE